MGKGRGGYGMVAGFLKGWKGGIFGIFLVLFYGGLEEEEDNL